VALSASRQTRLVGAAAGPLDISVHDKRGTRA